MLVKTVYSAYIITLMISYSALYQLFDLLHKHPYIISTYIITLMAFLTSVKSLNACWKTVNIIW